jgi:hypothetical protein
VLLIISLIDAGRMRSGHPGRSWDGRNNADAPAPYLAQLAASLHVQPDVAPYVALLRAAIADLKLTHDERAELAALASRLGLDNRHRLRAHCAFLDGLVDAALADDAMTDVVFYQLCRATALLDLDLSIVTMRTDTERGAIPSTPSSAFRSTAVQ